MLVGRNDPFMTPSQHSVGLVQTVLGSDTPKWVWLSIVWPDLEERSIMKKVYSSKERMAEDIVDAHIRKSEGRLVYEKKIWYEIPHYFLDRFSGILPSLPETIVSSAKRMYDEVSAKELAKRGQISAAGENVPRGLEEMGEELQLLTRAHEEAR